MTYKEACLSQKSRADVARVYWLIVRRNYKPNTAMAYVRCARSQSAESDRHGNVYRARMALKDFDEKIHPKISDRVIREYYNRLTV
jgi:hypothetical protein